jgi:GT2 family glycosyltransferase
VRAHPSVTDGTFTLPDPSSVRLLALIFSGILTRLIDSKPLEALRHAIYRSTRLSDYTFLSEDANAPLAIDAVDLNDGSRALLTPLRSAVVLEVALEPGAAFVARCELLDSTGPLALPVVFDCSIAGADGSWSVRREVVVRSGARHSSRFRLPLPPGASGPATIRLSAAPVTEGPDAGASPAWIEPRMVWRRSVSEMLRLFKAVTVREGLPGSLRRLLHGGEHRSGRDYQVWLAKHERVADLTQMKAAIASFSYQPLFSVITPVYNTDPRWLSECIDSVQRQVYPRWELCIADDGSTRTETLGVLETRTGGDSRIKLVRLAGRQQIVNASNAALELATGDYVAFLDHDDSLAPEALFEVAALLNAQPDADFIYTDEDKLDPSGHRCDPYFKPDWSPEHFLTFMYTNHLMVLRRQIVEQVGRFRSGFDGAQDYDLALRVASADRRIHHIPKVLYHWRQAPGSAAAESSAKGWALTAAHRALTSHVERNRLDADVLQHPLPGFFRVRPRIRKTPLVTIVIPTDDRMRDVEGRPASLLTKAVRSIAEKTDYENFELLIVDNGRLSDHTRRSLADIRHRRVSYAVGSSFNFAHKLNFSVSHARGEHIALFNDDLEVINREWLTALLEHSQDPGIGVVGAKLFFPDGRLQHIGIVLGVCGIAAHAFHCAPGSSSGYYGSAIGTRNYSAVTGAALMTRRDVWEQLGGFDERFAIDFNDIDYCLRARRAGYRVVFTPYAQLYHYESGTFGPRIQGRAELELALETWRDVIENDPYYNANLTRHFPDFRPR